MERSEDPFYVNSSMNSSWTENDAEKEETDASILKVGIKSGNDIKDYVNNMDFGNNLSFTSTNSSMVGKSFLQSFLQSDGESSETNGNNNMRNLFCHVLTKLDELEDQLITERQNYEVMKNKYDKKFINIKVMNENLSDDIDDIYDDLYTLDTRLVHCEQYSRRESVVISGIPDNIPQKELEPIVLGILEKIGLYSTELRLIK